MRDASNTGSNVIIQTKVQLDNVQLFDFNVNITTTQQQQQSAVIYIQSMQYPTPIVASSPASLYNHLSEEEDDEVKTTTSTTFTTIDEQTLNTIIRNKSIRQNRPCKYVETVVLFPQWIDLSELDIHVFALNSEYLVPILTPNVLLTGPTATAAVAESDYMTFGNITIYNRRGTTRFNTIRAHSVDVHSLFMLGDRFSLHRASIECTSFAILSNFHMGYLVDKTTNNMILGKFVSRTSELRLCNPNYGQFDFNTIGSAYIEYSTKCSTGQIKTPLAQVFGSLDLQSFNVTNTVTNVTRIPTLKVRLGPETIAKPPSTIQVLLNDIPYHYKAFIPNSRLSVLNETSLVVKSASIDLFINEPYDN